MTGSVVEQLVPTPLEMNTSLSAAAELEAQRIGVASAVALLSGIIMVKYTFLKTCRFGERFFFYYYLFNSQFLCSQLCMFGLQLGFLSTYLSEPIVKAFTSAAAFHVTVSQLQNMLGLRLPRHTGTFSLFRVRVADRLTASSEGYRRLTCLCVQTLGSVVENLPHTNMAELLISLVCLAVLVPVKEINIRYRKRLHTPIPVEILTVS